MSALLTSALALAAQTQDAGFDRWIADRLVRAGEHAQSEGLHDWAAASFERALRYAPDHPRARAWLGYVWKGGRWVRVREQTLESRWDDSREAAVEFDRIVGAGEIARECAARDAWREALVWDPDHAEARRALGFSKVDGRWLTDEGAALARAVRDAPAKADAGVESDAITDIERASGLTCRRRVTEHFVALSTRHDAAGLEDLARHAEAGYAALGLMLGIEPPDRKTPIVLVFVSSDEEHRAVVSVGTSDARHREALRGAPRSHFSNMHALWESKSERDFAVHAAVHSMGHDLFGDRPGLIEGLAAVVAWSMFGTAVNWCANGHSDGPNTERRRDSTQWRSLLKSWSAEPAASSSEERRDRFFTGESDAPLMAWSVFEFLSADYREPFLKMMDRLREDKSMKAQQALEETFGWSMLELLERRRAYVRSTYE